MKSKASIIVWLLVFYVAGAAKAQDNGILKMGSGGVLNPLQAIMDIRHYTLSLAVDIQQQSIDGFTEIELVLAQPTDTLLLDLVHLYTVKNILVNHTQKTFTQKEDKIYITGKAGFKAGRQKVKIMYAGKPPIAIHPPWQGGFTFTKDSNGNPWVAINCQMEGGKIYYPCKDHPSDEPNEGADLFITVDKGLVVAGPGLLQSVKNSGTKSTYHWKTKYTISNYCILFNIANYKVASRMYTSVDGHTIPIQFYVLEEDTAHAEHLIDLKVRDTKVLEKYFGEYPWAKEKIGIAEVPNPGMEHQTMITYGAKFKYVHVNGQDYSDNLYHEYGHEWFANKVTNKDWAHMWIQEGITTYSEALFFREAAGEKGYDSMMVALGTHIRNSQPVVQGGQVNTLATYNGDIYTKGAFFMHTLRYVLGDSLFFPTLKKLATDDRYTYSNFVTTDDVEQLFSAQYGNSLQPLFDFYLRTTSKLEFVVTRTGFAAYTMTIKNSPMALPLDISTSEGIVHIILSNTAFKIKSSTPPIIDANGHYLKTVLME